MGIKRFGVMQAYFRRLLCIGLVVVVLCGVQRDAVAIDALPSWAGQATSTAAGMFGIPGFVAFCPVTGMIYSALQATAVELIFGEDGGATGVFMYLMPCLTDLIRDTAYDFIDDFYDEISGIIDTFLVIAVAIFGITVATGGLENVKRDAMTFVIKLVAIVGLTQGMGDVLELMYSLQDDMITAATGYISTGSFLTGFNFLHCNMVLDIWMRADCIVHLLLGVKLPSLNVGGLTSVFNEGTDTFEEVAGQVLTSAGALNDGLVTFFWDCIKTGSVLALAGIVGMYMIFQFVVGLCRAANIYLMSMLAMALMAVIGGFLLPLMIMRSTYSYFDRWARNFISVTIQPVILFIFLNIAFTAFDIVLMSGQNSLMHTIAGDAVDDGYDVDGDATLETGDGEDDASSLPFSLNEYIQYLNASRPATSSDANAACINVDLDLGGYTKEEQDRVNPDDDMGGIHRRPITPNPADPNGINNRVAVNNTDDPRDFGMCLKYNEIEMSILAAQRSPAVELEQGTNVEKQYSMDVVGAVILAWLATHVFSAMLKSVPTIALKLTGGGHGAALT